MKKTLCLFLVLCLMMTMTYGTFALNYEQCFQNEATFETLEEARVNGPVLLAELTGRMYVPDPALNDYPEGTTYIYRSANQFSSLSAASRMNTTILVYADESFANKDAAKAYLDKFGILELVDEARGSAVLVTPISPENGFGVNDQRAYVLLQSAMTNIGYSVRTENASIYYADNAYFGGLTYRYLIGMGDGASFLNNFVASTYDYVTRVAGMLLVGGSIDRIREVASFVPVYLINPSDDTLAKYMAANQTNAKLVDGNVTSYYNQNQPLQKVCVEYREEVNNDAVSNAYYSFLIKAMRNAVLSGRGEGPQLNNATELFANYNFNISPFSLADRTAVFDGKTADNIHVIECVEDRFSEIKMSNGDYLQTWYEVLPAEVLNNTAPAKSVPLVLATHGGGDDPVQFLDEIGWLNIASRERIGIVAPYHGGLTNFFGNAESIVPEAMPKLVEYMLNKYPALDPARVYASGYSMGGGASIASVLGKLELFAAVAPTGAVAFNANEQQKEMFSKYDLPALFITSTSDLYIFDDKGMFDGELNPLADHQGMINQFLTINEMKNINYDFDTYQYFGTQADIYKEELRNNEYMNRIYLLKNDAGVPMVGLSLMDFLRHALYQEYSYLAWEFMRHYSRDLNTGAIIYKPYAK